MTKAKRGYLKNYCSEPLELVENYQQAEADGFKGWCIHHRLEIQPDGTRVSAKELIDQNLYYGRPASELVFMRREEHISLHHKDKVISADTRLKMSVNNGHFWKGRTLSEEHRQKIAESLKGRTFSAETRLKMSEARKGRTFSEETRQKLSAANKGENNPLFGKHHSDETRFKMSEANKGKHWWNDGISNKRSKECPGPEWKRGRIRFYDL